MAGTACVQMTADGWYFFRIFWTRKVLIKVSHSRASALVGYAAIVRSSSGSIGYGYYCTDTLSVTIHDVFDVDGDGVPDAVVYYLEADVPSGQGLELGGVRVTWRRQVSPAPVGPTFGDVPASDGGFQFIEAMAASAITGGCGGGNYCPEAHVTRRQMAIFLAKALGLHWGN